MERFPLWKQHRLVHQMFRYPGLVFPRRIRRRSFMVTSSTILMTPVLPIRVFSTFVQVWHHTWEGEAQKELQTNLIMNWLYKIVLTTPPLFTFFQNMFVIIPDNPEARTLTVRNLNISSYTFTVKALTSVGEGGENSVTYQMNLLSMPYSVEVHSYCCSIVTMKLRIIMKRLWKWF